jgi:hypothetical protein
VKSCSSLRCSATPGATRAPAAILPSTSSYHASSSRSWGRTSGFGISGAIRDGQIEFSPLGSGTKSTAPAKRTLLAWADRLARSNRALSFLATAPSRARFISAGEEARRLGVEC